jgi:two-component system sensor histidine kinase CiaH
MFTTARVKLTAWYLAIIMSISLSFSVVIYAGVNRELLRFDAVQKVRQERVNEISLFLRENGIIVPSQENDEETESLEEARLRIIYVLGFINLTILLLAGAGGYFLAGLTLEPIKRNMDEQKMFVSDASHELRTPLTSLKIQIEVALRDKKLSLKEAKELLSSSLEDVDRMQKLSNYLLKMNRYEGGRNLEKNKIDLKSVATDAVGARKVKTDLASTTVTANYDSMVELATILLDNAIKYGKGKGVMVKVGKKKFSVTDYGAGISEDDLPHIFDRFYRSDKSRGTEGYGLGLSIARSIAEANGASIKVKSVLGKGSTFTVQF